MTSRKMFLLDSNLKITQNLYKLKQWFKMSISLCTRMKRNLKQFRKKSSNKTKETIKLYIIPQRPKLRKATGCQQAE